MKINGFEILYLCDIGSRARGLESPTSDHDLFAIFRQSIYDYVKLKAYKSDFNINNVHLLEDKSKPNLPNLYFDLFPEGGSLQGMNIRKFCELLRKSNPTAIEMCISPVTHYDIIGKERLIKLAKDNFNPIALYYHYIHLANDNFRKYISNREDVTVKRYLNVLRGIDNANYILKNEKIPPMKYEECITNLYASQSHEDELRRTLIENKRNSIKEVKNCQELNSTIELILKQTPELSHLNNPSRSCDNLDELLCEFVR